MKKSLILIILFMFLMVTSVKGGSGQNVNTNFQKSFQRGSLGIKKLVEYYTNQSLSSENKNKIDQYVLNMNESNRYSFINELCSKNPEKCNSFVKAYTTKDCANTYFQSLCNILVSNTEEDIIKKDFENSIKKKISQEEKTRNKKQLTSEEINGILLTELKKKAKSAGFSLYFKGISSISDFKVKVKSLCVSNNKNQDSKCLQEKKYLLDLVEVAQKNEQVKTNYLYDFMQFLNPDSNSVKTASFLFEKHYSSVPSFLKESVPSQICLSKIEGYLDKDIKTTTGITKYGCDEKDNKTDISKECLKVLGDLRAERTPLTPDKKVDITYSYYVQNPKKPFKVELIYKGDGIIKSFTLENKTRKTDYNSVSVPLEYTNKIDSKYFIIRLQSGNFKMEYPVIMIDSATTLTGNVIGNSNGNALAQSIQQSLN